MTTFQNLLYLLKAAIGLAALGRATPPRPITLRNLDLALEGNWRIHTTILD
ncbi:hypothetical protein SAMN05446935_7652 [Burkholderia sp. YR290]|nr:hypothetical protein SAMN05446935_7652 [Burkholderia sp. YR290]